MLQTVFDQQSIADGLKLLEEKQFNKAIKVFEEILKNDQANITAINALADAHNKLGNTPATIQLYKRSLRIKENQPDIWVEVGNIYYHEDSFRKAENAYGKAVFFDSSYAKGQPCARLVFLNL